MKIQNETDLINNRQEVAGSIKKRLNPELFKFHTNERLKMVFDLEMHLAFLASAMRCESVTLFTEYVTWTQHLLISMEKDSEQFLTCLKSIEAELIDRGSTEWAKQVQHYLAAAYQKLGTITGNLETYITEDNPHKKLAEDYIEACLDLKRDNALEMIHTAVKEGIPVRDVYLQVITPALHELGRLWHLNQITVGQEHYCTAVTQMVMAQLFPSIFDNHKKIGRMVATCVTGELHEIGARMVTDLFELHGWSTVFLGADVPNDSIIETLIRDDTNVLAISATIGARLSDLIELVDQVRKNEACSQVKILVGGAAFNADNSIWKRIGADGWASDPEKALSLAQSWIS